MRNQRKTKRFDISLSREATLILEFFEEKYGTGKSEIITRALKVLAANYNAKITISYSNYQIDDSKYTKEEMERMMKIAKTPWLD